MASPRPNQPHLHHAARARDAALRRLSVLNRLTAVGAVGLALGFTALAARATPPRHAAAAVGTTSRAAVHRPATGGRGDDGTERRSTEQGDDAGAGAHPERRTGPSAAPAPTPQPPVVVSGGS